MLYTQILVIHVLQVASLCLQAKKDRGVCIIVTPLTSLALDQVSLTFDHIGTQHHIWSPGVFNIAYFKSEKQSMCHLHGLQYTLHSSEHDKFTWLQSGVGARCDPMRTHVLCWADQWNGAVQMFTHQVTHSRSFRNNCLFISTWALFVLQQLSNSTDVSPAVGLLVTNISLNKMFFSVASSIAIAGQSSVTCVGIPFDPRAQPRS